MGVMHIVLYYVLCRVPWSGLEEPQVSGCVMQPVIIPGRNAGRQQIEVGVITNVYVYE
jgi:hypothetical protein